jgi:hypothetical protein
MKTFEQVKADRKKCRMIERLKKERLADAAAVEERARVYILKRDLLAVREDERHTRALCGDFESVFAFAQDAAKELDELEGSSARIESDIEAFFDAEVAKIEHRRAVAREKALRMKADQKKEIEETMVGVDSVLDRIQTALSALDRVKKNVDELLVRTERGGEEAMACEKESSKVITETDHALSQLRSLKQESESMMEGHEWTFGGSHVSFHRGRFVFQPTSAQVRITLASGTPFFSALEGTVRLEHDLGDGYSYTADIDTGAEFDFVQKRLRCFVRFSEEGLERELQLTVFRGWQNGFIDFVSEPLCSPSQGRLASCSAIVEFRVCKKVVKNVCCMILTN